MSRYFTVAEWAKMAGLSRTNAYYWLRKFMKLTQVGGHAMVKEEDVNPALAQWAAILRERERRRKK